MNFFSTQRGAGNLAVWIFTFTEVTFFSLQLLHPKWFSHSPDESFLILFLFCEIKEHNEVCIMLANCSFLYLWSNIRPLYSTYTQIKMFSFINTTDFLFFFPLFKRGYWELGLNSSNRCIWAFYTPHYIAFEVIML